MGPNLSEARQVFSGGFLKKTSFPKQDIEERRQIDSVLFAIWARGQKQRSGVNTSALVLLSALIAAILWIAWIPRTIVREIPRILFSVAVGYGLAVAFGVVGNWNKVVLAFVVYTLLQREPLICLIRNLVFDLGDVLFLGSFTRSYINRWETVGPMKIPMEPDFMAHLFTSRILSFGDDERELSAAQDFFSSTSGTSIERKDSIAQFWDSYPLNTEYWRTIEQRT